jgi:hypothetical protein
MAMPTELQPVNIQRLLKQNYKFAEASQYAKSITTGSIAADWHDTGASSTAAKSAAAKSSQQEAMLQKTGPTKSEAEAPFGAGEAST